MSSPPKSTSRGVGTVLAACIALSLPAVVANAQIGPARRVMGAPVAAEAVHARFVWGAGGGRIIVVNQADEVYYHRLQGNRVLPHIRMRGHTIGVRGDSTEYVIPWATNQIMVVTQAGHLYRHNIRSESIGPPEQVQGAPIGTNGQDPIFMFRVQNRLINVTQQGEVWAHVIGRTVMPGTLLGRVGVQAPAQVRHVFNLGRTVYVVSNQGQIFAHDIHPHFGRARMINARTLELGSDSSRFLFVLGNALFNVQAGGALFKHDISRLTGGSRRGGSAAPAQ